MGPKQMLKEWLYFRVHFFVLHQKFKPAFTGATIGTYVRQALETYDALEEKDQT